MTSRSSSAHAFRSRPLRLVMASLTLLAFLAPVGTAAADDGRFPDLGDCQQLRVDDGSTLFAYLYAVGTQNYQWNGMRWVFIAPDAMLFADAGYHSLVVHHFAGPTWESLSGSQVVGAVIDSCVPDPDSIPWLLLGAVPKFTHGPGIFDGTTFIQRLNTAGGKAPSVPGDHVGQLANVPYTANYVFYR